jgi:hypothetical protein
MIRPRRLSQSNEDGIDGFHIGSHQGKQVAQQPFLLRQVGRRACVGAQ